MDTTSTDAQTEDTQVALTAAKQKAIGSAVQAYFDNLNEAAMAKKVAQEISAEAKQGFKKVADNQLAVLNEGLKDVSETVTEAAWNTYYKAQVAQQILEAKTSHGDLRFSTKNSREQTLHMLKVATIGLTAARHDKKFMPSPEAARNLKKYMDEVKPKLHAAKLVKAQDEPKAEDKPEKKLKGDTYYYLFGHKTKGKFEGLTLFVHRSQFLSVLQTMAQEYASQFPGGFSYCVADAERLTPKEKPKPLPSFAAFELPAP